jgi:hypothetical protein
MPGQCDPDPGAIEGYRLWMTMVYRRHAQSDFVARWPFLSGGRNPPDR